MKAKFAVPVILIAACGACANSAMASDEFVGAILGGVAGAAIGHAIGGHDGAVAGGAFGAIVGAAASDQHDDDVYYGRPRAAYGPPQVVYEGPRAVYAPPPVVVQYTPGYDRNYGHYGWQGARREHDGRWHQDHDGRWDHRGW